MSVVSEDSINEYCCRSVLHSTTRVSWAHLRQRKEEGKKKKRLFITSFQKKSNPLSILENNLQDSIHSISIYPSLRNVSFPSALGWLARKRRKSMYLTTLFQFKIPLKREFSTPTLPQNCHFFYFKSFLSSGSWLLSSPQINLLRSNQSNLRVSSPQNVPANQAGKSAEKKGWNEPNSQCRIG